MLTMAAPLAARTAGLAGWRRALVASSAGGLAALAMPPLGMWPLLFLTLPIFVWLLDGAAAERPWTRFAMGWLFGFGYFIVAFHWIAFAFLVDAATYLWMMPFAVGGLAAAMAIYWGLAALAATALWPRGVMRVVWLAACLAAAEWLRGHLLTGFPWAAPGLATLEMGGLAQTASLIGMTGLTFFVVAWAALPALIGEPQRKMRDLVLALAFLAILPFAWVWGEWRLSRVPPADVAGVKLGIVQPNIPQNEKWREDNARPIFEKLMALSAGEGVTHVIWPESAVPFLIESSPSARARIAQLLEDKSALVMGALRREGEGSEARIFNSIIAFGRDGQIASRYDKWRLVPGGEFLPFESILEPLGFRKVVTIPGSFIAGPGPRTLPVPGAPEAGFLVCYETIFPDALIDPERRPAWLVNVTNDGWFGRSTGPWQHLAQARLRAIEQGLPMVRAANTGVSAVIDARGQLRHALPLGAEGTIASSLPGAIAPTIYARFGDWWLAGLVFFAALLNLLQLAAAKGTTKPNRR